MGVGYLSQCNQITDQNAGLGLAMREISLFAHHGGLGSCGHFDFMVLHIFGFSF